MTNQDLDYLANLLEIKKREDIIKTLDSEYDKYYIWGLKVEIDALKKIKETK